MRRPLLSIAGLFLAGIAVGPVGSPLVGLAVLGGALACWRRALAIALVGISAFMAGAAMAPPRPDAPALRPSRPAPDARRPPTTVVAALRERPVLRAEGWRAEATLRWGDAPVAALVAGTGGAGLGPGDRVAMLARVRPLRPPGNPGGPPARTAAEAWAAPVAGTPVVPVRASGEAPTAAALDQAQRSAMAAIDRGMPPLTASIVAAMLLGEAGRLDPRVRSIFAETGTAHLLAISGLHLGLIAAFVLALLDAALRRVQPLVLLGVAGRVAAAATIAVCAAYTALSGAHVPTVRALVMIAVHLGARVAGRRSDAPTSLAVAALILVVADPGVVADLGFQLSFSAVGGLLLGARAGQRLMERLPAKGRGARLARGAALLAWTSTVAWLATGPLVLARFGSLPLLAPLINIVAIPALGLLIMPLALVTVPAAALVPDWAPVLLWPLDRVLRGLVAGLQAARPLALPVDGAWGWAALFAVAGGALLLGAPRARRAIAAALAVTAAVGVFVAASPPAGPPELLVAFLDVGHGDAAVIRLPDGTGIVVDGGGQHGDGGATGQRIVLPALRALGVTRLRAVVLTHPDADHLLGLLPVVAAMPPDELWWNGQVVASPTQVALVATAAASGARIHPVGARTRTRTLAGVTVEVLSPGADRPDGTWDRALGTNESSVVLRLRLGDVSFLLMGDAEVEAEHRLVSGGRLGRVSVVKVPHHGSTTSSTAAFVRAVGAAHAVFSCDEANRHGLPKQVVLDRWRDAGARVHRTDHDGAIIFATDGQRLHVSHGRR